MNSIKITVVGDGSVGKTSLLVTYKDNVFPEEYVPTVFDNSVQTIYVDDVEYTMKLWDTAGQEDYAKLRPLSYPGTQCFIICYSIAQRSSYENVALTWGPEVRHYAPHTLIFLVGTKLDMRIGNSSKFTSHAEGLKMKQKIGAAEFIECSALKRINLTHVFESAVRCVVKHSKRRRHLLNCRFL